MRGQSFYPVRSPQLAPHPIWDQVLLAVLFVLLITAGIILGVLIIRNATPAAMETAPVAAMIDQPAWGAYRAGEYAATIAAPVRNEVVWQLYRGGERALAAPAITSGTPVWQEFRAGEYAASLPAPARNEAAWQLYRYGERTGMAPPALYAEPIHGPR